LTGFDQRRGAEIDTAADMRKNADSCDHDCAKQCDGHDLQMRGSIRALH
jgi:hypothetical protein